MLDCKFDLLELNINDEVNFWINVFSFEYFTKRKGKIDLKERSLFSIHICCGRNYNFGIKIQLFFITIVDWWNNMTG